MDNGFNIVDFMDLPGFQRCVVRLILRETELTYPQLQEAITTLPEDQQMECDRLDEALASLVENQWLIHEVDGKERRYRVAMHKHNTSNRLGKWDSLELESTDRQRSYHIDLEPAERMLTVRSGGKRKLPTHVWECLTDPPEERTDASATKRTGKLSVPGESGLQNIH